MLKNVNDLRMIRQHIINKADEDAYRTLYRDLNPGTNIYWCGFGEPPSMTFRTTFDDKEFNRIRQENRELLKGRFAGGNVGFIEVEEFELFIALYKKPYKPSHNQELLLELILREGPMNIAVMKEMTGLLVKEITPALHKLQESFLIYEDQYDGDWERGWYRFDEMFPDINVNKYTKHEALKIVLQRFAFRYVYFNVKEANSFYRIPTKDIQKAIDELINDGIFINIEGSYLLTKDIAVLETMQKTCEQFVLVLHRNDFLVKCNEYWLKEILKKDGLDTLQYILLDGEFIGAVVGKFRFGPYDIEDVIFLDNDLAIKRKKEILNAIHLVNDRDEINKIKRYCGEEL